MPGAVSPELYTRWIQFGVFSPILRTHTTKNPGAERRLWAYPEPYAEIMRNSYLLRYALIPYIYTAAREAYDTGISMLRPMYYDWPESPEAYDFKDEYMFGDDMLVAPVTSAMEASTELATKSIWLPPGTWIEWFTGAILKGPAKLQRSFALDEIPVYVKAGAIVPLQPKMLHTGELPVDPLILVAFPGAEGSSRIYGDSGNTLGYKSSEFSWTEVTQQRQGDQVTITIPPLRGSYPGMPGERAYELRLPFSWPPESVSFNGRPVPFSREGVVPGWHYDGDHLTTIVSIPRQPLTHKVEVTVSLPASAIGKDQLLQGAAGAIARVKGAMAMAEMSWPNGWAPDVMIHAAQTGNRIALKPATAVEELERLQHDLPEITARLQALAQELLTMKDNGEGFGFTPQEQRAYVLKAIAHLQGSQVR
jgi:alpha-glucosidase